MGKCYCLRWFALGALIFTGGCASGGDPIMQKGSGSTREYDVAFDTVWDATGSVLDELGLTVVRKDRERGLISATKEMTVSSWGENVGIFVEAVSPQRTRVEVVCKRKVAANDSAIDWEGPILNALSDQFNRTPTSVPK